MNRQTLKVEIKRILYLIEHMVRLDIETDQFMKQMAKCLNYKLSDQEISNYVAWYDTTSQSIYNHIPRPIYYFIKNSLLIF